MIDYFKSKLKFIQRSLFDYKSNFQNERDFERTSYSQSGEDLIISYIFKLLGINKPSYLDIGAHHPYYLSNTALLYKNGSVGINVEPDPKLYKEFIKSREKDTNINIGIATQKGTSDFFIISTPTLNTFSRVEAERYIQEGDYRILEILKTNVDSVDSVVNEFHNGRFPHFLNIDAEGVDELIIKSIDFTRNYPLVICVETLSFSTSRKGTKNQDLIELVTQNGYFIYADTYLNTIFVKTEIWNSLNDNC